MKDGAELAEWVTDQCRQLEGQDFFVNAKAGIGLLIKTLIRHAENRAHIERMITTWIESTRQMLHPSDIPGLAQRTNEREKLPEACEDCEVIDYIIVRVNGQDGVSRCSCARGQRLAELDKLTLGDRPRKFTPPLTVPDPEPDSAQAVPVPINDYQTTNRVERFRSRERPPQLISAEEVESARAAELARRAAKSTIQ
jgi:hypothetical protein